jgi:hypothetical protein
MAVWCGLGGCYERTVKAPGYYEGKVYEPNYKDDRIPIIDDLEDAIFEPKKDTRFGENPKKRDFDKR